MKNIMKSLALVAVAAMSFVSCSNNFEDVNVSDKTFQLTISSEKPALENDSRTEFSNGSVIWNSGDQIRACYYHSSGAWSNYYASTENSVSADGVKATFSGINTQYGGFPAQSAEGTYTFYAGYPKNAIGGGATAAPTAGELSVVLPTEQTMPKAGTFDANADIMLGVAPDVVATPVTEISVMWNRLVAHGCVTLKNLAAEEGEIVKHVTFTAPEDVKLTGNNSVSFVDEGFVGDFDNNTVTVNLPANTEAKVAELPVWFCSAPATILSGKNLTVTVETTRGIYTRTITANANGIKFLQNRYNTLGINMASATFTAHAVSANVFQKITSMAELTTGEYVVAVEYNDTFYAIKNPFTLASSRINAEGMTIVTVANEAIAEADAEDCVLTLTANGNAVSIFDGKNYLAHNSSTSIKTQTDEATWTVSYENDMFKFLSTVDSARALLLNWNGGTYRIATYNVSTNYTKDDYSGLYLFKKTVNDPNAPSLSVAQTEVNLENTECEGTIAVTAENIATINVVSNVDWLLAEIDEDGNLYYIAEANEGAARTATVTLSAEGVADVVVTFNQAANQSALPGTGEGTEASPYDVTRAYAVIDAANGGTVSGVYVKGIVTDVVSFNSTYNSLTYHISVDGTDTNKLQAYSGKNLGDTNFASTGDLHAGDEVVICGDLKKYNTTYEFDKNNYIVSLNCPHEENSIEQTVTFTSKPESVEVGKTVNVKASAFTTVTYSSNNTAVATIDATTGVVTGVKEGTVTITATAAAEGVYKQAIVTYTLTVKAAQSGGGEVETVTSTFVTTNPFTYTGSGTTATLNANDGVVSIVVDKNTSTSNVGNYTNPLRFYQNHRMKFTSTKPITKIVFNYNTDKTPKALTIQTGSGTFSGPTNNVGTYTYNNGEKEVVFIAPSQVRFTSIQVTYQN